MLSVNTFGKQYDILHIKKPQDIMRENKKTETAL